MRLNDRYDLHCHSSASDGSLTPMELIDLAKKKGLCGICISDHDTLDAYSQEVFRYAHKQSIKLIEGVEVSTCHKGVAVHVLAYGKSQKLSYLIDSICIQRQNRNKKIMQYLQGEGFDASLEDVKLHNPSVSSLGRPHIANYMVKRGFVKNFKEAFCSFLRDERIAHLKGWALDTNACIKEIQACGARAIIAHPHLFPTKEILLELMDMGLDGLECYYANFTPDAIKPFLSLARERHLLITGGSDFHGDCKPFLGLGASYTNGLDFQNLGIE